MIETVPSFRVVCDDSGCDATAQDGDYIGWAEASTALDEATDAGWYATEDDTRHLCVKHAPRCPAPDCGMQLFDDEFGAYCPACADDRRSVGDGEGM